jgi:hypothetical protein
MKPTEAIRRERSRLRAAFDKMMTPTAYLGVFGLIQVVYVLGLRRFIGLAMVLIAISGIVGLLIVVRLPLGWRWKYAALVLVIGLATVLPTVALIGARAHLGNTFEHDGLVQTEAAVDRLVRGQPIYGVDWSNTDVARYSWELPRTNPALHHYGYFPLVPLVGVPWRLLSQALGTPSDYRVVLLGFLVLGMAGVTALPIGWAARFMVAVALFLDPFTVAFFWAGRNDLSYIALLLLGLALLSRDHPVLASLFFGIATALKPFAALAVPLVVMTLWLRWGGRPRQHRREVLLTLAALLAPTLLSVGPFLLTDAGALWRDTILYYNGGIPDAYPINGYGFGQLLFQLDIVKTRNDAFPFVIFQLAATLPTLWLGWRALKRQPTLGTWLAAYLSLFFAFAFFSRLFNDNYFFAFLALSACLAPLGNTPLVRRSSAQSSSTPQRLGPLEAA